MTLETHSVALDPRNRLLELSKNQGHSLAALSQLIDRNPSYLQQFIRKGSPRKLEEEDRRRLAQFLGVAEEELGGIPSQLEEKSYIVASIVPSSLPQWVEIPRLDIGASAGPGAIPGSEKAFDAFCFSRAWLREMGLEQAQLSAITVEGDSMEPLLRDGDDILVDRSARSVRDGIHVIRLGDILMVKRVANAGTGRLTLLSQNLAYPPIDVALEEIEIIRIRSLS